jgi:uncharacterized repeat protein (TIGR01451 family)
LDYTSDVKTTYYYWITAEDGSLPTPLESPPSLMITMARQVLELISQASSIVDVSVVDRSGQRTGFYHGVFHQEIPNSFFNPVSNSVSVLTDSLNSFNGIQTVLEGKQTGVVDFSLKLIDSSQTNPITKNLFEIIQQPVQINQVNLFELDWIQFLAGQPYSMNIKTDFTGDGFFEENYVSPNSPQTLTALLDFDLIHLNWSASIPTSFPIRSYLIFRSLDNQTFTLLAESTTTSYTDNSAVTGNSYYYMVAAVDSMNHVSPNSPAVVAGPVTTAPKPELNLSVDLNKTEFRAGEDIIYHVEISNKGFRDAVNAVLVVTIPPQIQYLSADTYDGEVQPNGQVIFRIGNILRTSIISFQINASVISKTIQETSLITIFDLQAKDQDTLRKMVSILLLPSKSEGAEQKISVVFKNTHYDSETGSTYINLSETLVMELTVDGFSLPYSLKVSWGDGEFSTLDKQSLSLQNLNHQFKSRGTMTILVKITDSIGRTKEVSLRMQVR